jgi:2-iminobutanoate/2-iminopropanoate deaminase
MKKIISTTLAPAAIGPYSQAVQAGNLLFCSGMIAIDPSTQQLNNASIETETKQVLDNIKNLLEAAGSSLQHVVKTTIFMKNMNDYALINAIYSTYFDTNPPAREAVEVSRLPKDVQVEISVIAVV